MKPHWMGQSSETAELEALQTDVMRFVAILGLCLAAIFSLVHSAAQEQVSVTAPGVEAPEPSRLQPSRSQPQPRPQPQPQPQGSGSRAPRPSESRPTTASVVQAAPPAQPSQPTANKAVFTLEFASAQALTALLRQDRIRLYAGVGERIWQLDAAGNTQPVEAPDSYYRMDPGTLPGPLLAAFAAIAPVGTVSWGVTLPRAIISRIEEITASGTGGGLVIGPQGSVELESQKPPGS